MKNVFLSVVVYVCENSFFFFTFFTKMSSVALINGVMSSQVTKFQTARNNAFLAA